MYNLTAHCSNQTDRQQVGHLRRMCRELHRQPAPHTLPIISTLDRLNVFAESRMYTWIDVSVSLTVTLCCASDAVETAAMKITMLEMVLRIVVTQGYTGKIKSDLGSFLLLSVSGGYPPRNQAHFYIRKFTWQFTSSESPPLLASASPRRHTRRAGPVLWYLLQFYACEVVFGGCSTRSTIKASTTVWTRTLDILRSW